MLKSGKYNKVTDQKYYKFINLFLNIYKFNNIELIFEEIYIPLTRAKISSQSKLFKCTHGV